MALPAQQKEREDVLRAFFSTAFGGLSAFRGFKARALAGCCLAVSACASAVNGSQEKVFIYSTPEEGAHCHLYQGGQPVASFTTPRTVVLQRSREQDLILNCAKSGFKLYVNAWDPDLSPAYDGNMGWFLGSLASLSVFIPASGAFAGGAAYDQAHQSAYGYLKNIEVMLKPLEKGEAEEKLPDHFIKPPEPKL